MGTSRARRAGSANTNVTTPDLRHDGVLQLNTKRKESEPDEVEISACECALTSELNTLCLKRATAQVAEFRIYEPKIHRIDGASEPEITGAAIGKCIVRSAAATAWTVAMT